jgi:hypothetical protein
MVDDAPLISWDLSEDHQQAILSLAPLEAKAETIEQLIAELGVLRGHMVPAVPKTLSSGQKSHNIEIDTYGFGIDPFSRKPVLSLRSAAFGWFSFILEAQTLAQWQARIREIQARLLPDSRNH